MDRGGVQHPTSRATPTAARAPCCSPTLLGEARFVRALVEKGKIAARGFVYPYNLFTVNRDGPWSIFSLIVSLVIAKRAKRPMNLARFDSANIEER